MTLRILICSVDAPFIGGTGTNSYNLIKETRSYLNWSVAGLFFHKDNKLIDDPHKIGGIWGYVPKKDTPGSIKTNIIKYLGGYPHKIFAKNYVSVLMANKLFPLTPIIFLPSGCMYYSHLMNHLKDTHIITATEMCDKMHNNKLCPEIIGGRLKLIKNNKWSRIDTLCWPASCSIGCDCELRACMISEKCIPNSKITWNMLRLIYSKWDITEKLEPEILISALYDRETINNSIRWNDRKIDILFGCFSWKRGVKNLDIVIKIVNHSLLHGYNITIVGSGVSMNDFKNELSNISLIGCVDNATMLNLMGNSKLFVCPSYYDSYPNMITEATLSGANIITSYNVGQSAFMSRLLVINEFPKVIEWVEKIKFALNKQMLIRIPSRIDILNALAKTIK